MIGTEIEKIIPTEKEIGLSDTARMKCLIFAKANLEGPMYEMISAGSSIQEMAESFCEILSEGLGDSRLPYRMKDFQKILSSAVRNRIISGLPEGISKIPSVSAIISSTKHLGRMKTETLTVTIRLGMYDLDSEENTTGIIVPMEDAKNFDWESVPGHKEFIILSDYISSIFGEQACKTEKFFTNLFPLYSCHSSDFYTPLEKILTKGCPIEDLFTISRSGFEFDEGNDFIVTKFADLNKESIKGMASEAVRRMFVSEFERNNGTRTKARKYESIMKSIILRERDHRFDEFITKFAKECIEEYKTKNELGILFGYDFDNKKGQDVEFFIDLGYKLISKFVNWDIYLGTRASLQAELKVSKKF